MKGKNVEIGMLLPRDLRPHKIIIPYIANNWTQLAGSELITPENYQRWFEYYLNLLRAHGYADPLALTIQEASKRFRTRPLWAMAFRDKGLNGNTHNSCTVTLLRQRDIKSWLAERERMSDNEQPVLIERIMNAGGTVSRLGIIRQLPDGAVVARAEVRTGSRTFQAYPEGIIEPCGSFGDMLRAVHPVVRPTVLTLW